jgi:MoaA/NifB/PqqE/SkfB family radical SAM enzyme
MSLVNIRSVADTLAAHGVKHLNFFNLGEPFSVKDVYEQLKIIRSANPGIGIATSTNGMLLDSDDKRRAALLLDYLFISLDGVDDKSVTRYQIGANFAQVYDNMRQLVRFRNEAHAEKPIIEWKYVIFRWNDRPEQVKKAIELAKAAGVDYISFWPTTTPLSGTSWRYRLHPFYKTLGEKSWKGRELDLRRKVQAGPSVVLHNAISAAGLQSGLPDL